MTGKIRVGVIFGGRSGEHEVSLVSATSVMNALDREKYEVVPIGITPEGRWISSSQALGMLKEKAPLDREPEKFLIPEPNRQGLVSAEGNGGLPVPIDVVFPLVHGTYGEDGTLQGLLELANIPYVGAGVLASSVGMDKIVQKMIFREAGLPLVRYTWHYSAECRENPRKVTRLVEKALRYPVFVKPANTGSSVGISKVHARAELAPALLLAAEFDRKVIVEQGVPRAREIECSVLGNDAPEASVPGEVIPSNEFYDYNAKYVDGKSSSVIPARIPAAVAREVRRLALRAYTAIDCAGMARVDFFVTKGKPKVYLNEVNTIPGFTAISMYPKMWEAAGLPFSALLDRLIALAVERHAQMNARRTSYAPANDWYRS
ncbi:MAG TPA: D-alanine--D-alanine ligase family protein [Bacteroidota bacterium]|nr:D-alanine--D-alanine ligase family protein [Bacteroidota bacterium]